MNDFVNWTSDEYILTSETLEIIRDRIANIKSDSNPCSEIPLPQFEEELILDIKGI